MAERKNFCMYILLILLLAMLILGNVWAALLQREENFGPNPVPTEQSIPEFAVMDLFQLCTPVITFRIYRFLVLFFSGILLAVLTCGAASLRYRFIVFRLAFFRDTPVIALSLGGRSPPVFQSL
jgi:hypothetical protein